MWQFVNRRREFADRGKEPGETGFGFAIRVAREMGEHKAGMGFAAAGEGGEDRYGKEMEGGGRGDWVARETEEDLRG